VSYRTSEMTYAFNKQQSKSTMRLSLARPNGPRMDPLRRDVLVPLHDRERGMVGLPVQARPGLR